jgi:hypothetical protein
MVGHREGHEQKGRFMQGYRTAGWIGSFADDAISQLFLNSYRLIGPSRERGAKGKEKSKDKLEHLMQRAKGKG